MQNFIRLVYLKRILLHLSTYFPNTLVYSNYKSKRTVRWDRQSQGIENVHNKVTKNIADAPPPPPLDTGSH